MSFRRRLTSLAASAALVLQAGGCGLHTGEESPQPKAPSYSGNGFSCVGRIPEYVDRYVNDLLPAAEIRSFAECLQKAFISFAQLTRGRDEKSYAPEEIRSFLHKYFLKDRFISDKLLHEFMVIKQAMVGGSLDRISRPELYAAVEMLDEVRDEALRLKPHLKFLNPKLAAEQDPREVGLRFQAANEALRQTIAVFTRRLERGQKDYSLAHLESFLAEFRGFIGWESHFQDAIPVKSWIDFLRVFKKLTVSPQNPEVIRPREWVTLLRATSRWYLAYLQFRVGVKEQPKLHGVGLANTEHLGKEVLDLLEESLSRRNPEVITHEQIEELIHALHELRWLPKNWRVESLAKTSRALLNRVFGSPNVAPNRRDEPGLTQDSLARMSEAFHQWARVQLNLDARYMDAPLTGFDVDARVPNLQGANLRLDARSRLLHLRGSDWNEFLGLREKMEPLFPEGEERVLLVNSRLRARHHARHEFHNLSKMNLLRSLTGLVFRGYAEQSRGRLSWDTGITSDEMEKFYQDFREIGIDLGFVDERNSKVGARAFLEGNLFTYSADGLAADGDGEVSGLMDLRETMEVFAFLYSGGNMAVELYAEIDRRCRKRLGNAAMDEAPKDRLGKLKLPRACVARELAGVLDTSLELMPTLKQFVGISPEKTREDYADNLLRTSFSPKNGDAPIYEDSRWVEMSELSTMAVVLHYAEAVMTRFDVNEDGLLTNEEIDTAVPIFRGFIKKFASDALAIDDLSDARARAAFYYILINKEVPSGWRAKASVLKLAWYVPDVALNRYDLATVFKVIIAKIFETGAKKADEPPPAADPFRTFCQGMDITMDPTCTP